MVQGWEVTYPYIHWCRSVSAHQHPSYQYYYQSWWAVTNTEGKRPCPSWKGGSQLACWLVAALDNALQSDSIRRPILPQSWWYTHTHPYNTHSHGSFDIDSPHLRKIPYQPGKLIFLCYFIKIVYSCYIRQIMITLINWIIITQNDSDLMIANCVGRSVFSLYRLFFSSVLYDGNCWKCCFFDRWIILTT